MHAARAVVADGGGDAVGAPIAVAADGDHRHIAMQALADRPGLSGDALPVKAIDHHVVTRLVFMHHHRLREAIVRDGKRQQFHLGRGDGIGVVVIALHLLAGHPLHTIQRLVSKRAMLLQAAPQRVERLHALVKCKPVQCTKQCTRLLQ
ncbi:hypothetical protein SDC9_183149 [bioreactor metagenome]|uniref:Uncharacterized protein n=1 Tax=bioreactor metagenome TaxID=1076179 RepID=A0A645H9G4_9ZZZZ